MTDTEKNYQRRSLRMTFVCVVCLLLLISVGWLIYRAQIKNRQASEVDTQDTLGSREAKVSIQYDPPSTQGYVGSDACRQCHQEIAESFDLHPMAQTIGPAEAFELPVSESSKEVGIVGEARPYDVLSQDGKIWHIERLVDTSGRTIVDQKVPMEYVVGSGQRAKAFLHRRDDALYMSPLNWYASSKVWDLAPSYAVHDSRGFNRRVTDECLNCHSGRPAVLERSTNRYQQPAFHELKIGCESCHGPGADHIAWQLADDSGIDEGDPICNPAKLDAARRESVCYRCHLQGVGRVLRPERSAFDFRPGQRLDEIWTVFVNGTGVVDGDTKSVSHVQQLRSSRCFQSSDGQMGCISCHDPHRIPPKSEARAYFQTRCFSCHQSESCEAPAEARQNVNDDCIGCHMPRRDTADVSHVSQTDHRILRDYTGDGEDKKFTVDRRLQFFDNADERLSEWERDRALAIGTWMDVTRTDDMLPAELPELLDRVLDAHPDPTCLTIAATIASSKGNATKAIRLYQLASEIPAARETSLLALMNLYYSHADWGRALEAAERILKLLPSEASALAVRADCLAHLNRIPEAIESAEDAIRIQPLLIPVRAWLVKAYAVTNQTKKKAEQQQILDRIRAIRRQPQ